MKSVRNSKPEMDVSIMDGAVLLNILKPGGCKTFGDYAANAFVPHIKRERSKAEHVNIVWNQYFDNSLRAYTREKHTISPVQCRRVEVSSPIPKNWQHFLRFNGNMIELVKLLIDELMSSASAEIPLVFTNGANEHCMPARDTSSITPCNHENHNEAEFLVMVYVADAFRQGFEKIIFRIVDADVVAVAVATVQQLRTFNNWIAFGSGKNFRYEISASKGPQKFLVLPVFHVCMGCGSVPVCPKWGKKMHGKCERHMMNSLKLSMSCTVPHNKIK